MISVSLLHNISPHDDCEWFTAIALDHTMPVGTCDLVGWNNEFSGIRGLHVIESYRRMGIAKMLISACINKSMLSGKHGVSLDVKKANAPAIAFYLKCGFIVTTDDPMNYFMTYFRPNPSA